MDNSDLEPAGSPPLHSIHRPLTIRPYGLHLHRLALPRAIRTAPFIIIIRTHSYPRRRALDISPSTTATLVIDATGACVTTLWVCIRQSDSLNPHILRLPQVELLTTQRIPSPKRVTEPSKTQPTASPHRERECRREPLIRPQPCPTLRRRRYPRRHRSCRRFSSTRNTRLLPSRL